MQVLALAVLGFGLLAQDASALSGSHLALPGQFPYQALVQVADGSSGRVKSTPPCAGALIDKSWVLTAASCVLPGKEATIQVTLGAFDLSLTSEESRVEHLCFEKIVHKGYNADTGDNDIALLRLSAPAAEDEYVRPIALPSKAQAKQSFLLWSGAVSGWGNVQAGEQAEANWVLRWFDSRVQPLFWCRLRNGAKTVRDSDLCLNSFWKKGTCAGDAGSPVAVTDWHGHSILVGIAPGSTAAACDNFKPAVFTRVTSYIDWISEETGIPLREK